MEDLGDFPIDQIKLSYILTLLKTLEDLHTIISKLEMLKIEKIPQNIEN